MKICASILAADYSNLGKEIRRAEEAGADCIHVDIMDGHLVPDITFGPGMVKALRPLSKIEFNAHLMIEDAEGFIDRFAEAGADIITLQVEACKHLYRAVQKIKQAGKRPAIGLSSTTSLSSLDWILREVDMVLLIAVSMGMGGQGYIGFVTEKVRALRRMADEKGYRLDIAVDGGIKEENIYEITEAGANIVIMGTTLFKAKDVKKTIEELRTKSYHGAHLSENRY
jgi:ribulose-phosphate 3-epimerase